MYQRLEFVGKKAEGDQVISNAQQRREPGKEHVMCFKLLLHQISSHQLFAQFTSRLLRAKLVMRAYWSYSRRARLSRAPHA